LPGGIVEQAQSHASLRRRIHEEFVVVGLPDFDVKFGGNRTARRTIGFGRENLGKGSMFWKIQVIVAEGIVFIHALIAIATLDCGLLSRHLIGIPPGILR